MPNRIRAILEFTRRRPVMHTIIIASVLSACVIVWWFWDTISWGHSLGVLLGVLIVSGVMLLVETRLEYRKETKLKIEVDERPINIDKSMKDLIESLAKLVRESADTKRLPETEQEKSTRARLEEERERIGRELSISHSRSIPFLPKTWRGVTDSCPRGLRKSGKSLANFVRSGVRDPLLASTKSPRNLCHAAQTCRRSGMTAKR
jgi:hypothetical protein